MAWTLGVAGVSASPQDRAGPCKRWVLAIFGTSVAESGGRKIWAPDTLTATHLQMPLEWMGYEVRYHDIKSPLPTLPLDESYAAVIVDGALKVPYGSEEAFAQWLAGLPNSGIKTFFFGDIPLDGAASRAHVLEAFGITGSVERHAKMKDLAFGRKDATIMKGEAPLDAPSSIFRDLIAPQGSEVFLSCEGTDSTGARLRFDAAFLASWGGALLEPYVARQYSPNHIYQLFEPFKLLERLLPQGSFPAPDPTTRDGRQALFSHIDGDGFTSLSNVRPGHINGEVIRDEILQKYPLPVTVSVIEANTCAMDEGSDSAKRGEYEGIARGIFALSNVQAASHTFSHPFLWIAGDDDRIHLNRSPRNITMKKEFPYPDVVPSREVSDSVRYINEVLAPKDRPTRLVLWSGNCRPPPEALADARTHGLLTLNGGNTIISKRWPGRAGIAPRTAMMDDELQVYAPAQNEMFYTHDWRSSFLGGFANVIQTFELTSTPRRLKPVNIYYHFYSGEREDAIKALRSVYDWALARPLHAITAETYIRSVIDARNCRITTLGPQHWRIECAGDIRTFRLPISKETPRVGLDRGITGWCDVDGQRYIHTNGATIVDLELAAAPQDAPSLVSSTAETRITTLDARNIALTVTDLRPANVQLHLPGDPKNWKLTINNQVVEPALTPDHKLGCSPPPNSTVRATRLRP